MSVQVNKIQIPESSPFAKLSYSEFKQKIKQQKSLYKNGNLCDVKLVKLEQRQYAIKQIYKERIPQDSYDHQIRRIFNQITILYRLNHPNIIKLYWHKQTQDRICLLFECFGAKLWKFVKKRTLDENDIKILLRQICNALKVMHDCGFVHRDVSSDNILVNQNLECKLIDFGYANEILGRRQTVLGTFQYMAPEVINGDPYNHKADIWSVGILLYELFNNKNPFSSSKKILADQIEENRAKLNFTFNNNTPSVVQSLVREILINNPEKRPDARQILNHRWFVGSQQDFDDIFNRNPNQNRQSQRKTQKPQIVANISKDMSISQLEHLLANLVTSHSQELIRKKQLLQELFKTERKLCEIRQQKYRKN